MDDVQSEAEKGLICCYQSNHSPPLPPHTKSPDMRSLLLLSCMHRICVRCAEATTSGRNATAADFGSQKVPVSLTSSSAFGSATVPFIECPLCREPTDANEQLRDALIELPLTVGRRAQTQPPRIVRDPRGSAMPQPCQFCDGSSASVAAATLWCPDCQKCLCCACAAHHRRFLPEHGEVLTLLAKSLDGDASEAPVEQRRQWPPLACPRHPVEAAGVAEPRGNPAAMAALAADHACVDCRSLCCATCAATCADAGHSVRAAAALGDRYVGDVRRRVVDLARELEESGNSVAQAGAGLLPALGRSRAAAVCSLLANKRHLLELLDEAFDEVKAKIEDAHAALAERASDDLVPQSRRLAAAAERATAYSRGILGDDGSGDGGAFDKKDPDERQLPLPLLLQHGLLLTRLEKLADRLRRFDVPHADAAGCLAAFDLESELPGELARHALTRWLGAPALRLDIESRELWSSVCRSALYGGVGGERDESARGPEDGGALVGGASGVREQLSPPTSSFTLPFNCLDMALNAAGDRVLVAAGKQGLIEYNLDGGELSRWAMAPPPAPRQPAFDDLATPATAEHLFLQSTSMRDFELDLDLLLQSGDDGKQGGVVGIGGVLSDGSAVLCIDFSSCVVLSRRSGTGSESGPSSGSTWYEARRVAAFEGIRIFSLSVNGSLVAAAEGFAPWPVPRVPAAARGYEVAFRVASVYSGSLQARQTVDREISRVHAVAIVPDIVVVSGVDARPWHEQQAAGAACLVAADVVGQDDSATVVAGFRMASAVDAGGSATCLWRVDRRYRDLRDMRATYSGPAVYVLATAGTAGATPAVFAVDGRFGDCMAELTLPDLLRLSYRFSAALAPSVDGRTLAFLHFNEKRIFATRAPAVRPPRW